MNVTAVIPVRLDSKRFPGKALADVGGKPLIRLVFDRVRQAGCLDRTLIATDSPEVEAACREFTDDIFFSTTRHLCGTDRVAEACGAIDTDVIVNVQTDEPMMEPALIDTLAGLFDAPALDFATAAAPIRTFEEFLDPNVVKVVCDAAGDALYFSRAPIPWDRDAPPSGAGPLPDGFRAWKHIGIYLYRKAALTTLAGPGGTPSCAATSVPSCRIAFVGVARSRVSNLISPVAGSSTCTAPVKPLERIRSSPSVATVDAPANPTPGGSKRS